MSLPEYFTQRTFRSTVALDRDGAKTSEIQLLKTGKFEHDIYGKFAVTEKDFDNAIAVFESGVQGTELAGNYNHGKAANGKVPAAGWIKKLIKKGKDALFAIVEHTDEAIADIKSKKFKYISAEFTPNLKDETGKQHGFALTGYALTNTPFLTNMQPVLLERDGKTVIDMQHSFTEQPWNPATDRYSFEQLFVSVPQAVALQATANAKAANRTIAKSDLFLHYREPDGKININGLRMALVLLEKHGHIGASAKPELEMLLDAFKAKLAEDGRDIDIVLAQKPKLQLGNHIFPLSAKEIVMLDQIRKTLNVESDDQIVTALEKLIAASGSGIGNKELEAAHTKVADLEKQLLEAQKQQTGDTGELAAAQAKLDAMNDRIAKFEKAYELQKTQLEQLQQERADRALENVKLEIATLQKDGYVNAAMAEGLQATYEAYGRDAFDLSVKTIKAGGPSKKTLLEKQGARGEQPGSMNPVQRIELEIKKLMDAEKVDYSKAAVLLAEREPALFAEYNKFVVTSTN